MGVTVKTASDYRDLTTIDEVKLGLDVTGSDDDEWLASLIHGASAAIEQYTNRIFARQTYIETVAGSDHPKLLLSHTPIQSITSITCDSEPIVDYDIEDADAGVLHRDVGWLRTAWVGWEVERRVVPLTDELNHTVEYEAGYLLPGQTDRNLPYDVEQACVITVMHWYRRERRGGGDVQSKKVGDLSVTYEFQTAKLGEFGEKVALPPEVRSMLSVRIA